MKTVAAILMAAILVSPRGAASAGPPGSAPPPAPAAQADAAPATPTGEAAVTVALVEENGSGMGGTATLTAAGDSTIVVLAVDGPLGGGLPAHLHRGRCGALDPAPGYPLTDAFPGTPTTTVVAVPLDRLLGGGFAIAVHRSVGEVATMLDPANVVACGQVDPAAGGETAAMPGIGTGTTRRVAGREPALAALAVLALVLAAGALARRRWEARG
jgi:hypothetical protein